jgi:catechol 2,3-dioxygenase-like lactoylglutathione lyase family enzyme
LKRKACILILLPIAVFAAEAGAGKVLRPLSHIHVVANLDKSVAFYRDAVGLDLAGKPGPLENSTFLARAKAQSKGAKGKAATFIIPGSEMRLVLMEFSGIEKKQVPVQRVYDPGVVRFSIQVRDIDKAFARVKPYKIDVPTSGGGIVATQQPRNNTRAVMMVDPDGFIFEFVQADPLPNVDVAADKNIYNARSSPVVVDTDKTLALFKEVFGFEARPTNAVNEAVRALEGTPDALVRSTSTNPPGSNNFWVFWDFTKIDRRKLETRVQDPGSPGISLLVENLPALLARVETSGLPIETESMGAALIRTPDGLLLELVEKN